MIQHKTNILAIIYLSNQTASVKIAIAGVRLDEIASSLRRGDLVPDAPV